MRRRTFEEMITYFNQKVSDMDINRKYKMELLGMITAILQRHDEDVAQIVRCKDCKYWMPHSQLGFDEDNGTYHDYCAKLVPEDEYYAFYRNADDYCSRAERRLDVDANT